MPDCLFCKIIKKEIPATLRYEDDEFIAFDDINPKAKTHILLLPKKHIPSLFELNNESLASKMLLKSKEIASEAGLSSFRLVINSGSDSGQEVKHLHLHILGGNKLGNIA